MSEAGHQNHEIVSEKQTKKSKMTGSIAQVGECQPSKQKASSSTPSTTTTNEKRTNFNLQVFRKNKVIETTSTDSTAEFTWTSKPPFSRL